MSVAGMTSPFETPQEKSVMEAGRAVEGNLIKGVLFLSFILIFLMFVARVIINPGTFPIKSVRIEGEFLHLSPAVLKESVINVVRGGFFDVNVETIQKTLLKNPWVEKVSVLRVWPDGLKVQVAERVPVARWNDEGLLTENAVFFTPDLESMPENLPLLSGPENTYKMLWDTYQVINAVLEVKNLKINYLILNDRRAWKFRLDSGVQVILGKGQIEKRINRFADYAYPALKNDMERISTIDMRYTNGFVISWNDAIEDNIETGKDEHG